MVSDLRPYFIGLPDPAPQTCNKRHKRQDIVMIALCMVISGVGDWVGMEIFAEEREA